MKITPVDVAHKSFSKAVYGLDSKEVTTYLQAIAEQLESLIKERNELRERLREREIQLAEYKERDQVLKNTLTTASQMSERIREDSERKADLTVQEARLRGDEIQKSTHESLKKAYSEINDLRALRIQFETNMRALAHAHLQLLEEGQKYMGMPHTVKNYSEFDKNNSESNEIISSKLSSEISPISSEMVQ